MVRHRTLRAVTEEDRLFFEWLDTVPIEWLECRLKNQHRLPDLISEDTAVSKPKYLKGRVLIESDCERCGTHVSQISNREGYLESAGRPNYIYPEEYALPPGAGHITRDRRAIIRLYILDRKAAAAR
jgi:hypothetical protein